NASEALERSTDLRKRGTPKAARTPMMTITTTSSTRVNPLRVRVQGTGRCIASYSTHTCSITPAKTVLRRSLRKPRSHFRIVNEMPQPARGLEVLSRRDGIEQRGYKWLQVD